LKEDDKEGKIIALVHTIKQDKIPEVYIENPQKD